MLHISLLVFGIMIWIKCHVNLGTIQVFKIAINVPRFPPYKNNLMNLLCIIKLH